MATTQPERQFYLRPPQLNRGPSGKKTSILGARREAVLNQWAVHAYEEHSWGLKTADGRPSPELLWACPTCAELVDKLKESETWT